MKALVEFLESEEREEQTVQEVAEDIIDAFYGLLNKSLKDQPPILHVGEPFKHAVTNKVHYVAWNEGDLYWVTTGDSRYGYLGPIDPWQKYASKSKAMSGAPGTNAKGWKVGDRVTFLRQKKPYTVLAVIDKAVLIQDAEGSRPQAEPNDMLEKYYNKQSAPLF